MFAKILESYPLVLQEVKPLFLNLKLFTRKN